MASGDTLLIINPNNATPPASLAGRLDTIAGGSTPAETIPCIAFATGSSEYMDFCNLVMPVNYAGGGITVVLAYSMASATSGGVRLELAFRRINDDAEVQTAAHSYDYNGVTDTVPSAAGEVSYPVITFTDGADIDSLAVGELFHLRYYRDHDNVGDDAAGDQLLQSIHIKET